MSTKKIMEAVLNTVDDNNQRLLIQHNGHLSKVISTANTPAEEDDIVQFEKQLGFRLPKDYRSFLQEYNGAHIYQMILDYGVNGGGGLQVFSVQELKENMVYMDVYPGFLPIGNMYDHFLAISLQALENQNPNYLYRLDNDDGPQALTLNFHLFLDYFVVSQGSAFWEWPIYNAASRYYLEGD